MAATSSDAPPEGPTRADSTRVEAERVNDSDTIRFESGELITLLPPGEAVPRALGEFTLVRELGRGGMGIVYEAIQHSLDRRVALKVLPATVAPEPELVERFRREAALIATLDHENIVGIYTYGSEPGWSYFAMELVNGAALESLLADGPLPLERTLDIALQVARALDAAHAVGVVHRDIKPSNILVEPGGRARVADFGLARRSRQAPEVAERHVAGTPEYMSPEQASGQVPTPATDIYSLGVLLYRMLAGRPPFTAEDPLALLALHQFEPARDLRQVARVPFELGEIVMRCLSKRPGQRFPSAGALRRALEAFRREYAELRKFLARDGLDTEAMVLDALGPSTTQGPPSFKRGLRYVEATVLVADLENFLRLAVSSSPERVTDLLETFYKSVREVIERHRGAVVEMFGDTVLATFGDPVPLADHPTEALAAALDLAAALVGLSRELRPPVSVRLGLETGMLLAGYVHDGRRRQYHAYGASVAIAHAFERHAQRGECLVGEALHERTKDTFEMASAGRVPVPLHGQLHDMSAHRLVRKREVAP